MQSRGTFETVSVVLQSLLMAGYLSMVLFGTFILLSSGTTGGKAARNDISIDQQLQQRR